jgi:KipI family sensor histidine kinase inhibitor
MRRIVSLGDESLLVSWPDESPEIANRKARAIHARLSRSRPEGVDESVPAAGSLLIRFREGAAPDGALLAGLAAWERDFAAVPAPRRLEVPVWYGGEAGVDLPELAAAAALSEQQFADRHSGAKYTVAFIGFSPGFPYLFGLPAELSSPRLDSPRTSVPAGSVAIGGPWTGIYPASGPGGWRLIGRTPLGLFDPAAGAPAALAPGDEVRFVPIDQARFAQIAARRSLVAR